MSVLVRSSATGAAQAGAGAALSAQSVAGDLAVLIQASQFGDTAAVPPPGWEVLRTAQVNARSGYVAMRRVTDPAQTQGVAWWSTSTEDAARQRGLLVVLDGVEGEALVSWQEAVPQVAGLTLLVSQQHGVASAPLDEWAANVLLVEPGETSTDRSWSTMRAGLVDSTPVGGSSSRAWCGVTLTESAEPPDPTPKPEPAFRVWDGARVVGADLTVWDGAQEVPATRAAVVPPGARTVDELLATERFIVAHRGGSLSWPEGTRRAYTQAAAHGVHAMEVPVCRTADGVWFVLHDLTLARLGGPDTDCRTMTWAQVQDAMAQVDGGARMPATLDWVMSHYLSSHVLIIDPKHCAWTAMDDYLGMLAPYRGRVMLKFSADATSLFQAWKSEGFRTWSYAYPQSQSEGWYRAMLSNPDLDVLSMSWDAEEGVWSELTATGKPVVSHIPGSAQAVAVGWERGAVGAMCSTPAAVLPLLV